MEPIKMLAKPLVEENEKRIKDEILLYSVKPKTVTVLFGDAKDSVMYVNMKHKACERVGINSEIVNLPWDISVDDFYEKMHGIINDLDLDGLLIQEPSPKHLKLHIERILLPAGLMPIKDIDGLSRINMGDLHVDGKARQVACTPLGVMKLIEHYIGDITGKHVVVIGRSPIVGRPMRELLLNANATVSVLHSKTTEEVKKAILPTADIIVSCVGKPDTVMPEHLDRNKKVVLIDTGVTFIDGKSIGDINRECYQYASHYTPYTGAVGPMTITTLLSNIMKSATYHKKKLTFGDPSNFNVK